METEKRKKRSLVWFISILLVVIFAVSFTSYYGSYGRGLLYAELNNLKLIPRSEHFTELYFENSSFLPKSTVRGQKASFAFTIHNVEGATVVYPYIVYFEYPLGHRVTLVSDNISLADNASTTISVSHIFLESDEKGKMVVELPSQNQSIDFLVPNNN